MVSSPRDNRTIYIILLSPVLVGPESEGVLSSNSHHKPVSQHLSRFHSDSIDFQQAVQRSDDDHTIYETYHAMLGLHTGVSDDNALRAFGITPDLRDPIPQRNRSVGDLPSVLVQRNKYGVHRIIVGDLLVHGPCAGGGKTGRFLIMARCRTLQIIRLSSHSENNIG